MKALSLFSGIGGIDLAAEWAGIETVAFCEREPFCQEVLKKHWPAVPIYDDVCTLTKERLEADGIGTIELIHGGYPCQPFSVAGQRQGENDDRHLWPEVRRLIETIKPRWFVGENVAGHITMGLDGVLSDLGDIGYTAQSFVIPACSIYAPHRRDRVFIVGYSEHDGLSSAKIRGSINTSSDNYTEGKSQAGEFKGASGRKYDEVMANATGEGFQIRRQSKFTASNAQTRTGMEPKSERCSEDVANSKHNGNVRRDEPFKENEQLGASGDYYRSGTEGYDGRERWAVEPNVGRVANGVPSRVDRLKSLGNAVVPQQIYPILAGIKQIDDMLKEPVVN